MLDEALQSVVTSNKPSNIDFIYYTFWKRGIDIIQLNKLPLPYIFNIMRVYGYIKDEEARAYKKANKK